MEGPDGKFQTKGRETLERNATFIIKSHENFGAHLLKTP